MKLLFYGIGHHKNLNSIKRMCKSYNIDLVITNDINLVMKQDYNILIANKEYIDPYIINENIKIIYGPQHWVFPDGSLIGQLDNKLLDRCVYNSLSKWNNNVFIEMVGSLIVPIVQFPFSLETDTFKPFVSENKNYDCIVYIKRRNNYIVNKTTEFLNDKKLKYKTFTYGYYNETDYINALHDCKFMISLDAHESQGFAIEEAMSCNVPLLVLDATSMHDETGDGGRSFTYSYLQNKKLYATSIPYWSDDCGIKITDINKMNESIDEMLLNYKKYNPREYILENLSDKICMKRILEYFKL